jgi:hypothetical protein
MSKIGNQHAIFPPKQHIKHDIIKTIMGYPPSSIPTDLKKWIEAIQSVGKGQEATQTCHDLLTSTGVTYGGNGQPMEIGRKRLEWSKDRTPKCYKCNQFGHIRKECPKKNQGTQGVKGYGCGKFGHVAKHCQFKGKTQSKFKIRSMNKGETTTNVEEIKEDFLEGLK